MHQPHRQAFSAASVPLVCPTRVKPPCLRSAGQAANTHDVSRRLRKTNLKLHQDSSGALNTVTGYGVDYVEINLVRHSGSILVLPQAPVIAWPVASFDALTAEHFAML